ncbi:MAG: 5-bromo-4-chloroindolyl phosphate hydrolysis family protein [Eubacteriales bacterium]|nr:5-bromo-4-chloroindolyl phosphate hydrolysis family protein [Eubacteriales bacterium]
MSRRNKRRRSVGFIYGFAVTWLVMAAFLPMYKLWAVITALCASILVSSVIASASGKKAQAEEEKAAAEQREKEKQESEKAAAAGTSYSPEVSAILAEGNRALSEMGRLYMSIKDPEVRGKINEIMRITDKIAQDAISDPSDIPQIKKFMNYYLPTTIKLLNAYDRMSAQGIEGENLDKSMKSINDMLDTAIEAYKKRLDSLFANQALDIETDIQVMNTMLAREGLSGGKDFEVKADAQ